MTPSEFLQQAMIHVGAALVKVYDEQSDGIVNNEAAQVALADNAVSIMANLEEAATLNPNGIFFDDEDDEE